MKLKFIAVAAMLIPLASIAQPHRQMNPANKGLVSAQDPSSLPVSGAAVVFPEKKNYVEPVVCPVPSGFGRWRISDGWTLQSGDSFAMGGEKYNAVVPGTVLTTLVRAGVYPDPYYGLNNMAIPEDLCRQDWWYTLDLPLDDEQLSSESIRLEFKGINYKADVWVNSTKVGRIEGAFIRGGFEIKPVAKALNKVAVHIFPPDNPGIPHEQSFRAGRGPNGGQLCLDGPTFISSEGWDWIPGIRDRNIGIWQDVELVTSCGASLGDAQVITDLPLPRTDEADVLIKGCVRSCGSPRNLTVKASLDGAQTSCEVTEGAYELKFHLDNPRLWMPNGYGEQNLYDVRISLYDGEKLLDTRTERFGVREFSYELSVDTPTRKALRIEYDPTDLRAAGAIFDNRMQRRIEGETEIPSLRRGVDESVLKEIPSDETAPYLVIKCNGVRIFCRGGNWGMDDGMKNCSREHLEPYLKLHRDAGFNIVRNWTGESTEDTFYTLCDEYGMLVWNDFWLSTEGYNLDPNDEALFMRNVEDVLKRFRNHPSIAVWCPRNEGYATESLERMLDDAVARLDGTRRYHPNSRYSNLRTSGPWHYLANPAEYYTDRAFGFNTEMGTPSIPTAESMRKFLPEVDRWPLNDVWVYHDLHFDVKPYLNDMTRKYGEPASMEDFCRKAQLMNYDSHRAMLESFNAHMWNNTSGVFLWMTHPAWPSVEWQVYSWDCETFGSYFGSRKACEPLHIQMNLNDLQVVVLNVSTVARKNLDASMTLYDLAGKKLRSASCKLASLDANSKAECFKADLSGVEGVFIARFVLKDAKGKVLSVNDYLRSSDGSFAALDSSKAVLKATRAKGGFTVRNTSKCAAIGVKFNVRDASSLEPVLPAFFGDAYINLLPGESRTVSVDFEYNGAAILTAEGYNVDYAVILK